MPWVNARVAHLLSVHRSVVTLLEDQTWESAMETIKAFSSWVISIKAEKSYTGECINIMTQVLQTEDSALPRGLTIQNVYNELWKSSKYAVMLVSNSTAYPQMLQKKALVARAVAVTAVPETPPEIRVHKGEDGPQDPHPPCLTTRQKQGKLF